MATHHHHHHQVDGKNMGIAIFLNVLITIAEIIGGIISGSISLLTEALHNFSDVLSLLLSFYTNKLAKREADALHTYGYKRAEILATFINSAMLIGIAFFLIYEAIERLINPVAIQSDLIIWFSLASIVANVLSVLFLQADAQKNMNVKSAYLHLLTDVMTSTAILLGGILMKYFKLNWIDSVLSILIALYLIYAAYHLLKESAEILMDFTPKNISLSDIKESIMKIDKVKSIKDMHVRQLSEHDIYFMAKIELENDNKLQDFGNVLSKIEEILQKYHIYNSTIQPYFI